MSTIQLSPLILLPGIGMILVGLGFVVYAGWQRLRWGYLGFGALMWIITVAVKFAWVIPMNPSIYRMLNDALPGGLGTAVWNLYVGLLTGVTEVAIVWLVMRYTRLGKVAWEHALAFGIGFGAIEAYLLGVYSFARRFTALLAPQVFAPQVLEIFRLSENVLYGIAPPVVERFFIIWVHIFSNVLIFYGVAKMQMRWFWLAFVYKSLIDAWGDVVIESGMLLRLEGIWMLEAGVILWGILGWLGTHSVRARYPSQAQTSANGERMTQ